MTEKHLSHLYSILMSIEEGAEGFDAAKEAITIASCRENDMPLVYVNKGFEKLTGYSRKEVIGKNCRFLQGPETQQHVVEEIRKSINLTTSCLVEFINYRKDGSMFWNRLSLRPIFSENRELIFYLGLQNNITLMKEFERKIADYLTGSSS